MTTRSWKRSNDSRHEAVRPVAPEADGELTGGSPATDPLASRRDFLKVAGFSLAAAGVSGCGRAPVERAIPFLVQPETVVPGRALHYASTCGGCTAGCGVLVKTREGRPIKLEGNPGHPLSQGGLCAVGQASVLGVYDGRRLRAPIAGGQPAAWNLIDREIVDRLEAVRRENGAVRVLTNTVTSPTIAWTIDTFLGRFTDGRHVVYDPLSSSAILDAHARTHRARVLPRYRFDRADVVVGLDADFLGTWISPVEFTRGYRARRTLEGTPPALSYHAQLEPTLTLTGSKADSRLPILPEAVPIILSHLATRLASRAGVALDVDRLRPLPIETTWLDDVVDRLWSARGRALVVSGSQGVEAQVLCNLVNHLIESYGSTIQLARHSRQRQGSDRDLDRLLTEMRDGVVQALLIAGVNPVFDLPGGAAIADAIRQIDLVVSFAERIDETAAVADYVCPDHHALESWSDAEPVDGLISVTQPTVQPIGGTRAVIESLAVWTGSPTPAREIMRRSWAVNVFPRRQRVDTFDRFWDQAVHDGFVDVRPTATTAPPFDLEAAGSAAPVPAARAPETLVAVVYPKVGMLDGRHAHNAWLQELPDPISKVTWDNYAGLAPATAARLGVVDGDVVRLEAGDRADLVLELPAHVQPGQHDEVVAVALGYGRAGTDRFTDIGPTWLHGQPTTGANGLVGQNAAILMTRTPTALRYHRPGVRVTPTGGHRPLASTQEHHAISVPAHLASGAHERRPHVEETTLPAFTRDPASGGHEATHEATDLWPADHTYSGHRWGMAIDLNACTGCSACLVSCQAENNVPVVGRDEVRRQREMHWIRIDRYYADRADTSGIDVVHQPMLCQHCENAPCETVCPVLATVHSEEGLNQQIYNRCVGTRYCANNCPYKVRRFNWFDYPREDRLQNLVLNPDVVVRSRGVMEKCSFCVQRIQEAKIEAARRGTVPLDGAVQTACEQSCPAQAIVFGDLNDPTSRVVERSHDPRRYEVLGELNVRPAVSYLRIVRNRPEPEGESHGAQARNRRS